MTLARLALRNVGRNRRRSALTAGVVALGFAALTLAAGFMAQSFEALREGTIRGGIGHLQLAPPAVFAAGGATEALGDGLADAAAVTARVGKDPAVRGVLSRVDFLGLASAATLTVPFVGAGLQPTPEAETMDTVRLLVAGRWLAEDGAEAVIGSGLAASLAAGLGDVITLLAMTADGVLNALDVEVVGIARLPVRELDDRYLATPLPTAQDLLVAGDTVSKLVVMIEDAEDARVVGERLRAALAGEGVEVDYRTWHELAVFYRQVRTLYLGIFGFLGSVLVVIVLLAAANSVLMATTERTREIGTLRALGMRPLAVARLFRLEGLLVGALGCVAGAAGSLALRGLLNRAQLELPAPPGVSHPIPLFIQLYPSAYLLAAVAMLLAAFLAAWLPARRAARRPIVEALAHV